MDIYYNEGNIVIFKPKGILGFFKFLLNPEKYTYFYIGAGKFADIKDYLYSKIDNKFNNCIITVYEEYHKDKFRLRPKEHLALFLYHKKYYGHPVTTIISNGTV